jgi:uncharacterized protein (DUF1697 family)
MSTLAAIFCEAGCHDVRTFIQSGNVVFKASPPLARRLSAVVTAALAEICRLDVPVVLRTAGELEAVARGNPFLKRGADPQSLHVVFLLDRPSRARIATLDPERSPREEFVVRGSEIYLHCPNGTARSKLTAQYFDSRLATTSTMRNWNTVLKLLELSRGR